MRRSFQYPPVDKNGELVQTVRCPGQVLVLALQVGPRLSVPAAVTPLPHRVRVRPPEHHEVPPLQQQPGGQQLRREHPLPSHLSRAPSATLSLSGGGKCPCPAFCFACPSADPVPPAALQQSSDHWALEKNRGRAAGAELVL